MVQDNGREDRQHRPLERPPSKADFRPAGLPPMGRRRIPPNVVKIRQSDPIYVGGGLVPDSLRSEKVLSNGRFVGVLYEMSVNKRNVGLWNYLESRGCRETHSGVTDQVPVLRTIKLFRLYL